MGGGANNMKPIETKNNKKVSYDYFVIIETILLMTKGPT